MLVSNVLKILLLLLGGVFIVLQGLGFEFEGSIVCAVIFVLLATLYCISSEHKSKYFFWFLVTFALAQLVGLSAYFGPEYYEDEIDYFYYASNGLYILSYVFLISRILGDLSFKTIVTQFYVPIIILLVLDVFCVILVTATTENVLTVYEYALEFVYNGVIMALLSFALINYMYRNDNKSMLFLLGSIFIVFSEIIQLTYYYVLEDNNLGFIYSTFLVAAFLFFYLQSQKEYTGPVPAFTDEQFNA